jgi:hypothetical protein
VARRRLAQAECHRATEALLQRALQVQAALRLEPVRKAAR